MSAKARDVGGHSLGQQIVEGVDNVLHLEWKQA